MILYVLALRANNGPNRFLPSCFPIGIQLESNCQLDSNWNPIVNWIPIGIQLPTGNPLESNQKVETKHFPISNLPLCTSWYIILCNKRLIPIGNWKSIGIQLQIGNPLESICQLESNWNPIGFQLENGLESAFSNWKLDLHCIFT